MSDIPQPPPPEGEPPPGGGSDASMDPSETYVTGGLPTTLPGPTGAESVPPGFPPPPVAPVPAPGYPVQPPGGPGAPGAPAAPGAYPPAGGYGAPPVGPPPTQAGWGVGGGVPPGGYGAPPPSGGGGKKALIIIVIVVFALAALVVLGAVLLVVAGSDDNDAPSVPRTTIVVPTVPPATTATTSGAQPGDSALDPPATTATTTSGSGDQINVFDLQVGDCFDVPSSGNITDVNGLDCDQPHDNEVFAIFSIAGGPDAPFPGAAVISRKAQRRCTGALFTDYVGVPFDDSRFNATSINPTQETWESELNDREVICVATSPDDSPLTASVRGANE